MLHSVHCVRPDPRYSKIALLSNVEIIVYIDHFMHPQAIVVDSTYAEEDYFLKAARDQVPGTKSALIELPDRPETRLAWISKLDALALSGRYILYCFRSFDLLVHISLE